jgi:hypothetical protein
LKNAEPVFFMGIIEPCLSWPLGWGLKRISAFPLMNYNFIRLYLRIGIGAQMVVSGSLLQKKPSRYNEQRKLRVQRGAIGNPARFLS